MSYNQVEMFPTEARRSGLLPGAKHVPSPGYDILRHYLKIWAEAVAEGKLSTVNRVALEFQIIMMQERNSIEARKITGLRVGHYEDHVLPDYRNRDWTVVTLEGVVQQRAAHTENGVTTYSGEVVKWMLGPSAQPLFLAEAGVGAEIIGMTVAEARRYKEQKNAKANDS